MRATGAKHAETYGFQTQIASDDCRPAANEKCDPFRFPIRWILPWQIQVPAFPLKGKSNVSEKSVHDTPYVSLGCCWHDLFWGSFPQGK
jgi:hypothetical protein